MNFLHLPFIFYILGVPYYFFHLQVNVVDGLKLYEDLFDDTEVSKLVSLVNDLRVSGKKGQFQGNCTMCVLPSHWKILSQLPFLIFT